MGSWFATPSALWASLLIAPLLVLFMLRHRPVKKRIPSILLWQGATRAQISTSPFQRLRKSLSLLLMLLALIALVLALAGFRIPDIQSVGRPLVIVIESGASMQTEEIGGTRFNQAIDATTEIVDAANSEHVSIMLWDGRMRTLTPDDATPTQALDALDGVTPSDRICDEALLRRRLESLANSRKDANVVFVGDRAPDVDLPNVASFTVGTPQTNAAITVATITTVGPTRHDGFIGVEWFGEKPRSIDINLYRVSNDGSDKLWATQKATLTPNIRTPVTFEDLTSGLYRASLDFEDRLTVDNNAWIRVPETEPLRVGVVGTPPKPLAKALDALADAGGQIRIVDPANAQALVVVDAKGSGVTPRLPVAFIAPSAPSGVTYSDSDEHSRIARTLVSPLWSGAGQPDLSVERGRAIETERWTTPLLQTDQGTVMALVRRDDTTDIEDLVIGFAPDENQKGIVSSFAFVILWANWFDRLRERSDALPTGSVSTHRAFAVKPLSERDEFELFRNDESLGLFAPNDGLPLNRTGVYRIDGLPDANPNLFGVSVLSATESNLLDTPDPIEVETLLEALSDDDPDRTRHFELAPWLVMLAMALVLFDWFWFRKDYPALDDES